MLLVSSLVSLYYNVIIAWTFYYLGMSLQSPLPWSCKAPQNAHLCQSQVLPLWLLNGGWGGGRELLGSLAGLERSASGGETPLASSEHV